MFNIRGIYSRPLPYYKTLHKPQRHLKVRFPCPSDVKFYSMEKLRGRIKLTKEIDMENYGKLSSEAYNIWFPEKTEDYEDASFYRKFINEGGQPALEVGCGNGRLLIPFLKEGLEVEGLDLSPYMIDICRKKAQAQGVKVNLYQQPMQTMKIDKKYNTIFIPYGSFMLVNKPEDISKALAGFLHHLNSKGKLLIPLFIPTESDIHIDAPEQNTWRLRREGQRGDGAIVKCWEKAHFDVQKQVETAEYRYEVRVEDKLIESENERLVLKWHTQQQFTELLRNVGFKSVDCVSGYSDLPAQHSDSEFTFIAQK